MTDGGQPPRFVCDEMLGQLAKWLRLLGHDTRYMRDVEDDEVLEVALDEERVLLSRDVDLIGRAKRADAEALRLRTLDPHDQLDAVVAALDLDVTEDRLLSRCSVCNVVVEEVALEEVVDEVPDDAKGHDRYWRCPDCERVYWEGTHVDEIRERVAGLR